MSYIVYILLLGNVLMMLQNRYEQNRIVEEIFSGWVCACVYVSVNFQIITQSQASNMGSNFQFEICV